MSFFNGILHFLSDLNNWVFSIIIGLMGKVSYELYTKRTLTVIQWVAVIGLSVFSGYLTSTFCDNNGLSREASWAVPLATLMGEKLFIYVMSNYKRILTGVLGFFMPKK